MYAEERQRTIVNLALRYVDVAVTELAQRFDVTHRDHPARPRRPRPSRHPAPGPRRRRSGRERPAGGDRRRRPRARLLGPEDPDRPGEALQVPADRGGSTVLIDSGTTTARSRRPSAGNQQHTVVTSSVPIASQLALLQGGRPPAGRPRPGAHPGHRRRRHRRGPGAALLRCGIARHQRAEPRARTVHHGQVHNSSAGAYSLVEMLRWMPRPSMLLRGAETSSGQAPLKADGSKPTSHRSQAPLQERAPQTTGPIFYWHWPRANPRCARPSGEDREHH